MVLIIRGLYESAIVVIQNGRNDYIGGSQANSTQLLLLSKPSPGFERSTATLYVEVETILGLR